MCRSINEEHSGEKLEKVDVGAVHDTGSQSDKPTSGSRRLSKQEVELFMPRKTTVPASHLMRSGSYRRQALSTLDLNTVGTHSTSAKGGINAFGGSSHSLDRSWIKSGGGVLEEGKPRLIMGRMDDAAGRSTDDDRGLVSAESVDSVGESNLLDNGFGGGQLCCDAQVGIILVVSFWWCIWRTQK